jgi:predicted site-specific integrase-resolvase
MGKTEKTEAEKAWGPERIMDSLKRAAIYVRVSTAEQETNLQEHELQEYCEKRGWNFVVYRDKGQSGAKYDRPALTVMMNDLRRRKIDVVVVWALDRLARSLKQLLSIAEECRSVGVDLVSLKQNVDTCGSSEPHEAGKSLLPRGVSAYWLVTPPDVAPTDRFGSRRKRPPRF